MDQGLILDKLSECGFNGRINYKSEMTLQFCPFHSHNYKSPSLSINIERNCFRCFSCNEKGHLKNLFYQFGVSFNEWRAEMPDTLSNFEFASEYKLDKEETNNADVTELLNYRFMHPYLLDRGFTKEILLKNRIGFDKETCRITIPIFYNNQYHGCIKRIAYEGAVGEPRYIYPKNLQKSAIFFQAKPLNTIKSRELDKARIDSGMPQVIDDLRNIKTAQIYDNIDKTKYIFLVEGSLDAIKIAQYGYHAVSALGAYPSIVQLNKLMKLDKKIVIAMDNDKVGQDATEYILSKTSRFDLQILTYPSKDAAEHDITVKDPGDMSYDMFTNRVKNLVGRMEWGFRGL